MKPDHLYSIDYLRMLLAGFVVLGHSGVGIDIVNAAGLILGNTVLRSAVPLFAVTAGYFLYLTIRRGRVGQWVLRLVAMYVLWWLVHFVAFADWERGLKRSLYEFLFGYRHLWFLQGLAIAGLMLNHFAARGPRAVVISMMLFGAVGIFLQYGSMGHVLPVPLEIYRSGPFDLYPFTAMGYLFHLVRAEPQALGWQMLGRRAWVLIALLGFVIAIGENLFFIVRIGPWSLLEFPIGVFLMVPAIFALVLGVRANPTNWPLARMAVGIYVMHPLVLHAFSMAGLSMPVTTLVAAYVIPALLAGWFYSLDLRRPWRSRLF